MRCIACDALLSEYEATKRAALSGDYVDLCNECIHDSMPAGSVIDRDDLKSESDLPHDWLLTDDFKPLQ